MTIFEALRLANKMILEHSELKNWIAVSNRRKRAFGLCSYRKKRISLSEYLVPAMTDKAIKDTIIHEIAHALTKGHGHDKVWQSKCIELGGNGLRCGGTDKYFNGSKGKNEILNAISKYSLTCPVCGHVSYINRKPKKDSSCGNCCNYFNPKFKLVLTQNY